MTELEELKRRVNADDGYMHYNGIEVTDLAPGYCEARAAMGPEKRNPHGMAHGGFLFTLCDSVGGIAATTTGGNVVGRTGDIHFLRPGQGAYFTARGRVTQAGRHMALCRVDVFDETEMLVATADVEMFFLTEEGRD